MKLRPIVKMHGGKRYLADWIRGHFPQNHEDMIYVEPFCGASSVFLNKPRARIEILNDLDPGIVAILRITRDYPEEFMHELEHVLYKEAFFKNAQDLEQMFANQWRTEFTEMKLAVNEFILRRMSRGGLKKAFAWSDRQRGGKPGDVNAWESAIAQLLDVSDRLQGVKIFNEPAEDLLYLLDRPDVMAYCDPPYLPKTRRSKKTYDCEMSEEDHMKLGQVLGGFKGNVLLSGNPSPVYDTMYESWAMATKPIANHSSQQKVKQYRTEALWYNYTIETS